MVIGLLKSPSPAVTQQDPYHQLVDGHIILDTHIDSDRRAAVTARLYIPCSKDHVWHQVTTYSNWPQLLPSILTSTAQGPMVDGSYLLFQSGGIPYLPLSPRVDIELKVQEDPGRRVQFELIRGDFEQFKATITLHDFENGTLLSYRVQACLTFSVPKSFIEQGILLVLPANLKALRQGILAKHY